MGPFAALLDRVPSLEDTMSCVEYTALLSTAVVRSHTSEESRAGAADSTHNVSERLPQITSVLVQFFEAEQKVCSAVRLSNALWLSLLQLSLFAFGSWGHGNVFMFAFLWVVALICGVGFVRVTGGPQSDCSRLDRCVPQLRHKGLCRRLR